MSLEVVFGIALELVLKLFESGNAKDSINPAIKSCSNGFDRFCLLYFVLIYFILAQALAATIYATIIPCF